MELIIVVLLILLVIFFKDIFQKNHTIQHNFPILGHLRFVLEKMGGPLRQYWFSNNREELPFDRDSRGWIYASSKKENNLSGFGSDKDFTHRNHVFIKNSLFPSRSKKYNGQNLPPLKTIGPNRKIPFIPTSLINISGMSYGALSQAAITALNKGAKLAKCFQNTGEGGLSPFHKFGADVIFQIGTGYFGVRDENGNFSMQKLKELILNNPCIRAIEIKLSQGAKPGKGGTLPGIKVSKELAEIRNVPIGKDVISPGYHQTFNDVNGLINFIEEISKETGLPVGIKSAVGQLDDWTKLAFLMETTHRGPDFITIDGGEGGTGAAPISFADNVSLPFNEAFTSVYKIFKHFNLEKKIVWIGSGKLGFPAKAIAAMAMGVDMINVGREALLSLGCIQAQLCHTDKCPTGITTNSKWRQAGLNPEIKSLRVNNYIFNLRKEIVEITQACGYEHPSNIKMKDVALNTGDINGIKNLKEIYEYEK